MPLSETRFRKKLFGGDVNFVIYSEKSIEELKKIMDETYTEALRLQKIFNFFDPESELSTLNSKRQMKVSRELFQVIETALKFSDLTNGKYNIGLGKSIRERKLHGKTTKESPSCKNINLNKKQTHEVSLGDGIEIDLGSIAKGYITDRIGNSLESQGIENFLIDARGDILTFGESFHLVEIQHPREKRESVMTLKLKNQGVATSGDYMQYHESFEKSHILNQSDFISVTVIAPTLELADVCATAIFVSGKSEIKKILEQNKSIKVMTIDRNLNAEFFNGLEELIYAGY